MDEEIFFQIYKNGTPVATVIADLNLKEVYRKGEPKELLDKLNVADFLK